MNKHRIMTALVCLICPSFVARHLLRFLGHSVGRRVKIGFSLIAADKITLGDDIRIGHFNIIHVRKLHMRDQARFGRSNIANGPLSISMGRAAEIGNRNRILRGPLIEVSNGPSMLKLGQLTKITSDHRLDCTKSIIFGNFCCLAGYNSEIWTHGYVHDQSGPGRFRVDGPVKLGNNVYVGSSCIINSGVAISDAINVGAGAVIAKGLEQSGLHVSQGLRYIGQPADPESRNDLKRVGVNGLRDIVYERRR